MKKIPISDAAELGNLLWPEFVEVKGCVFLKRERSTKHGHGSDPVHTESFYSHTHVLDQMHHKAGLKREPFFNAKHSDFRSAYEIGRKMCYMWALKLLHDFPSDDFRVYLHGFDPIVRFHKIRKGVPNWAEAKYWLKAIRSGEAMILDTRELRKARSSSSTNAGQRPRR